jgi:energy-converting hydrogenase Eha subunit H
VSQFYMLLAMFMVGLGVFLGCKEEVSGEAAFCGGMVGMVATIPLIVVIDVVSRLF